MRHRFVLLGLLILLGVGLWYPPAPPPKKNSPPGGDIVLYRAVVERVSLGEPYYPTMRAELRRRGYPTASIFNWRSPATLLLMARAPSVIHIVMLSIGALAAVLGVYIFRSSSPIVTFAAIVLLLGSAVLPFVPVDGLYVPELWAGLFLLLSVIAHTLGFTRSAICCAVAAACARELALPFVFAGLCLAAYERKRSDLRWYAFGIAIFVAYYAAHVATALSHIEVGDMAHTRSWVTFGGWPFVVTTVNMGGWYMMLPRWAAAAGAVVVLASLWGPADRHLKMMVLIYLLGFSIIGQPFNNSWGLLTGPAWGLATVYGLLGLSRIVRSSVSPAAVRPERLAV